MERTRDEIVAGKKAWLICAFLALVLLLLMLTGCASYVMRDGTGRIISQGEAVGFLRTITVVEEYDSKGNVISRKISTESTTKDVLMGFNELIDTAADTFGKLKP